MNVPISIAHNLSMRFGSVQRIAERRHRTGSQSNRESSTHVFDRLASAVGSRPFTSLRILELGPGKGYHLSSLADERGAQYAGYDVQAYLSDEQTSGFRLGYKIGNGVAIPWPDQTFDVVWSHSVLEHVRSPLGLLLEAKRVLKYDGTFVASIDLQDHYTDRRRADSMYGFLRYSDRTWSLLSSNRSIWVNRLRASDWRRLIDEAGFDITHDEPTGAGVSLEEFRSVDYLAAVSDDDLATAQLLIAARARG